MCTLCSVNGIYMCPNLLWEIVYAVKLEFELGEPKSQKWLVCVLKELLVRVKCVCRGLCCD